MNVRKVLCWQIFSFDFGLCVVPALNAVFCERGRTLAHYIYIYIYTLEMNKLSLSLSLSFKMKARFLSSFFVFQQNLVTIDQYLRV